MTKNTPNVVYKNKYSLALNSVDNKNQSLDYKNSRYKDIDDMIDYFSNIKKKAIDIFDYLSGDRKSKEYNLILENGQSVSPDEIKTIKSSFKKHIENSNLWKGIISFKNGYLEENIDIKTLEQKFAKEIIPQFLKYCGFKNIKNMSYVFSIHTNNEHQPHIHFAFVEKKPNYIMANKKVGYRRMGKITKDEQRYLKRLVELVIEREKYYTPLLKKTNEDIDYLKSYFNSKEKNFILRNINNLYIEEDILKLGELVKQYREKYNQTSKRVKYNSLKNNRLGKEIKTLTNEIKKYLFNDDTSTLFNSRKEINKDLEMLNNYFDDLNKNNNIEELIINNSIVNKKEEYIDNYIYNSIVNHSIYKYEHILMSVKTKDNEDKITIEDLIQEVAYRNSKSDIFTDKQRRRVVLNNYFKANNSITKFPNKHKMEKALKNINYEMEQASQEFSKLFNYEDKSK